MRVALIGGTGLVGGLLLRRLLEERNAAELHALSRRPTGLAHPRLHEHIASAEEWREIVRELAPEKAVSALGTTIRKAGSTAAFRKVDHDMCLEFARAAKVAGARHMLLVSSAGASARSRNFYLQLKGEVEQALEQIGFEQLDIFRPGLLRGNRGSDRRLKEQVAIVASPITNLVMRGPLRRYAAIDAVAVAAAMHASLGAAEPGVHIHHNSEILRLAGKEPSGA
jgi:uncharacterized protein YbjT (DUF2867 family)